MAVIFGAILAPAAGAAAAGGALLGSIGSEYASEGLKLGFERMVQLLVGSRAEGPASFNHDLARAIRRAHLDGLEYLLNRFERDLDDAKDWKSPRQRLEHRPFLRTARQWIRAQREASNADDFGGTEASAATAAEARSLVDASLAEIDERNDGDLRAAATADALEEFLDGLAPTAVPTLFLDYFEGRKSTSWYAAAQSSFAQTLKDDPGVRSVLFIERLDGLFRSQRQLEERLLQEIRGVRDQDMEIGRQMQAIEDALAEFSRRSRTEVDADALAAAVAEHVIRQFPIEQAVRKAWFLQPPNHSLMQTARQVAARVSSLTGQFVGRGQLLRRLDEFADDRRPGLFVIGAPTGAGKSALLANWLQSVRRRYPRTIWHFVSNQDGLTTAAGEITGHLAAQLLAGDAIGSEAADVRGQDLYALLLAQREPTIVVVDGLDEAASILEPFIESDLPGHVRVIVSGRADLEAWPDYLAEWQRRSSPGYLVERIDLPPLDAHEVLLWLEEYVGHLEESEMTMLARQLHATTDGLPLYLSYVVRDLAEQLPETASAEERLAIVRGLPAPFSEYLAGEMRRSPRSRAGETAWTAKHRRLFALLSLLKGSMRADEIGTIINSAGDELDLPHRFSRWLSIRGEGQGRLMTFAHPRLAEAFGAALTEERAAMLPPLISWCRTSWRTRAGELFRIDGSAYALDWLTAHLAELGEAGKAEAARLLADAEFLIEQLRDPQAAERRLTTSLERWSHLPTHVVEQDWAKLWSAFWAEKETSVFAALRLAPPNLISAARLVEHALADAGSPGTPGRPLEGLAHRPAAILPTGLTRTIVRPHGRYVPYLIAVDDGSFLIWTYGKGVNVRRYSSAGIYLNSIPVPDIGWVDKIVLLDGFLIAKSSEAVVRLSLDGDLLPGFEGAVTKPHGGFEIAGGRVVTWDARGAIQIWSSLGEPVAQFDKFHAGVRIIGASGRYFMTSSLKGLLRIWSSDGLLIKRVGPPSDKSYFVTQIVGIDGGFVTKTANEGSVRLYREDMDWKPVEVASKCADIAPLTDQTFLSWHYSGLCMIQSNTGDIIRSFGRRSRYPMTHVQIYGDRIYIKPDNILQVWSKEGNLLQTVDHITSSLSDVIALNDRIIMTDYQQTVRLWDVDENGLFLDARIERPLGPIVRLADAPGSGHSRFGCERMPRYYSARGASVIFLDAEGDVCGTLDSSEAESISAVQVDDGLLSWSPDGEIQLWNRDGVLRDRKPTSGNWTTCCGAHIVQFHGEAEDISIGSIRNGMIELSTVDISGVFDVLPLSHGRKLLLHFNSTLSIVDSDWRLVKEIERKFDDELDRSWISLSGDYFIVENMYDLSVFDHAGAPVFSLVRRSDDDEVFYVKGALVHRGMLLGWNVHGEIRAWTLEGEVLSGFGRAHDGAVLDMKVIEDGFLSLGEDGVVWRWSAERRKIDAWVPAQWWAKSMLIDEERLVTCGSTIQIYDLERADRDGWSRMIADTLTPARDAF